MIYCEELHLGKWMPALYDGKPSKPSHGNSAPQRRGEKQVATEHEGKALDWLKQEYGADHLETSTGIT